MKNQTVFKDDPLVLIENEDLLSKYYFSNCPVGWSELVRQLFIDIRKACANHKSPLPLVLQVKSKFGGLSFYLDYDDWDKNTPVGIEVERLINKAEKKSYTVCEITGQPGSGYSKGHWYATLNEKIAKEMGYEARGKNEAFS